MQYLQYKLKLRYKLGTRKTGLQTKLAAAAVNIGDMKVPYKTTELISPRESVPISGKAKYSFLKSYVATG